MFASCTIFLFIPPSIHGFTFSNIFMSFLRCPLSGPASSTGPGELLGCVLGEDTLLSQYLSPPNCTNEDISTGEVLVQPIECKEYLVIDYGV